MNPLITVKELGTKLRLTIQTEDPYAAMMIEQASNKVRFVARQPGWLPRGATLGSGQSIVPDLAHDIALWLAERAYTNTGNLQRRTAGPISDSFFENGVRGLELTEAEEADLKDLRPNRSSNGLWIQPIGAGPTTNRPVFLPDRPGADGLWYSGLDEGAFGPVI